MASTITDVDLRHLRRAISVSVSARANGNHPFGAVLADATGQVVAEAENTVETGRDVTGHAETNLVRIASAQWTPELLASHTLYTSCEPCTMCTGAIFWSGITRIVFALSVEGLMQFFDTRPDAPLHQMASSRLLTPEDGIEVLGPALESEAAKAHKGFWTT
ncbi:MAG TPA: nucleoside deaminase [Actinobacteria bacterium]|nr:nucleoside deaminase [Actinomycetota bacterium]